MNLEQSINRTYQNIAIFIRDLFLEEPFLRKYHVGQILRETSFVDMTYKIGGISPNFNTRFVILSNRAINMEELEQDTSWGLFVLPTNSYFKLLDLSIIHGITVITLLHFPTQDLSFFQENEISIDFALTQKVKEMMMSSLKQEVPMETKDEGWYKRVNFPIGMNEQGDFFSI